MDKRARSECLHAVPGEMERCVLCWELTDVPRDEPVSMRNYYIPGQGQLCARCYYALYGEQLRRRQSSADAW